jgi:rRNA maturation protein Nop10
MALKPGERTRVPRPHQWSTERRMQEARAKNSTKDNVIGKTASGWLGRMIEAQVPDGSVLDLGYTYPTEKRTGAIGEKGICPVCGTDCEIVGKTADGRLVGECEGGSVTEAFTLAQWQAPDDGGDTVKTAQVSVHDTSTSTMARGTIVKVIKGVEFELDWTYSENNDVGEV